MKKNDKQRLFEVMGRLDKTFKPSLNENIEDIANIETPETSGEEEVSIDDTNIDSTEEPEELSPEEKLSQITTQIDSLYAMIHGEEAEEEDDDIEVSTDATEEPETSLNEHHLNDRKSQEDFICKNDESCKKEDLKDLSDDEVKKKYVALEKKMGIVD